MTRVEDARLRMPAMAQVVLVGADGSMPVERERTDDDSAVRRNPVKTSAGCAADTAFLRLNTCTARLGHPAHAAA